MERLEDMLSKPDIKSGKVNKTFQEIAETLMGNYIIKKREKSYAIVEIEFYLYTPHHQDFITYPRNLKAGRWFFHQSGVDLTFSTIGKPEEKNNSKGKKYLDYSKCVFGGILIRGLYRFPYTGNEKKNFDAEYIYRPQKVVNELWDDFNAFDNDANEYPILKQASEEQKKIIKNHMIMCKRHIKIDKSKTITTKEREWAKRIGVEIQEIKSEITQNESRYNEQLKIDILNSKYRFLT